MTALTREHTAIAELVVYIPVALVSIFVVLRHGFHRQLGWIYLAIFAGIRIGGAVMEILSHNNPSNSNDREWALILQSVGLSPLLLSSLGLLKRVCDEVSDHMPGSSSTIMQDLAGIGGISGKLAGIYSTRATANSRRSRCVQLLHIPALIALALSISGGTDQFSSNPADHASGRTEPRVGIILYLLVYICLFLLCGITFRELGRMQKSQRRIFLCILLALPLIALRLLYSLIGNFESSPNNQFSIIYGSSSIQLGMATIEEFIIVLVYAILGVFTPRAQPASAPASAPAYDITYVSGYPPDPEYAPPTINYAGDAARPACYARNGR